MIVVPVPATSTLVPAAPPKLIVAPVWNPVPLMVTDVPPLVDPAAGRIPLTAGGGINVYAPAFEPLCVSGLLTTTSTAPAACAGVLTVIVLALTTATLVPAPPPKLTVAPAWN